MPCAAAYGAPKFVERPSVMKTQSPLQIYKSTNAILVIGQEIQAGYHSHHALQVSVSLDAPFGLTWQPADKSQGENTDMFEAVMLAPNTRHQLDGRKGSQALLLIDPEYAWATQITQQCLAQATVAALPALVVQTFQETLSSIQAKNPIDILLNALRPKDAERTMLDPRISAAMEYLQSKATKTSSAREVASQVHLSESRLGHLFKQQVGIPVRRYQMWLRLMDAIDYAFAGQSLTDAAAHAGFADSAHFSRTFQAMFGIPASAVVKHSQFVQVP